MKENETQRMAPLQNAGVRVFCLTDSTYHQSRVTDEDGNFTLMAFLERESIKYPEFHTECGPLTFWSRAEDYHQRYLDRNPSGYCHIPPWKMESVRSLFDDHF